MLLNISHWAFNNAKQAFILKSSTGTSRPSFLTSPSSSYPLESSRRSPPECKLSPHREEQGAAARRFDTRFFSSSSSSSSSSAPRTDMRRKEKRLLQVAGLLLAALLFLPNVGLWSLYRDRVFDNSPGALDGAGGGWILPLQQVSPGRRSLGVRGWRCCCCSVFIF